MTSSLHPATWVHLDWVLVVVVAWLLIGVFGVLALRRFRLVAIVLFPVGALFSVLLLAVALSAVFSDPETAILPLGLPVSARLGLALVGRGVGGEVSVHVALRPGPRPFADLERDGALGICGLAGRCHVGLGRRRSGRFGRSGHRSGRRGRGGRCRFDGRHDGWRWS